MTAPNNLRQPIRLVTGHDNDGKSIIETFVSEDPPSKEQMGGLKIAFCYGVQNFPVDIADDKDILTYQSLTQNDPGIVIPNGCAARLVDIAPDYTSPMHRSLSVNYNWVIEGEVELVLDSGERRLLKRGDCVVQRAIMHAWANPSKTQWARITAVSLPATT